MTDSIHIRSYDDSDEEAVCALWKRVFPDDPPWNEPKAMLAQKKSFQAEGLLVGEDKGRIVAAVMAGYDGHRGWINAMAVDPAHRAKGYGKELIDAAIAKLEDMGAVKVNLQVRGNNMALRRYYESLGFEVEDRISMSMLTRRGEEMA
ncbi:GNAT family acetyltransferase [Alphaproteobacteria bacterium LSUCC0684]